MRQHTGAREGPPVRPRDHARERDEGVPRAGVGYPREGDLDVDVALVVLPKEHLGEHVLPGGRDE